MRLYVIRLKGTELYLPEREKGAGYTSTEPADPSVHPPRLFTSIGGARRARTWWKNGVTTVTISVGWTGEYDENWHSETRPQRADMEMEIIPMILEEETCDA